MVHLQKMWEAHEDDGLVVLGLNSADEQELAVELLNKHGVTFPNILDGSKAATKAVFSDYRTSGVPVNFIIDREGVIAASWYGFRKDDPRAKDALRKLGIE